MTRFFYLIVSGLTLWAAAAQWLPREGLPTQISFGPDEARAQAPAASPLFPQPPLPVESKPVQGPTVVGGTSPAALAEPTSVSSSFDSQPPLSTLGPVSWQPGMQELEEAKVLARVGGEVIMAGEVLSSVKGYLVRNKMDPNSPEVAQHVGELVKMRTMQLVETRIVCNEAKRKIPPEGFKSAMAKFDEEFDTNIVPQMIKDRKLQNIQQLEAVLKNEGTTIEREKRSFGEQVLKNSWLSQSVKVDMEVTHEDLLRYYHEHGKEFETTAQARWEQISVRFDRIPGKAEAYAAIAQAGNQVLDGRPFAEVAKQYSHGSTASDGGVFNWTNKGSLVSQVLDRELFTIPVGTLSAILEDERGFHIIRVIERRDGGRKPFTDVQSEIRKKVTDQRGEIARAKYLEDVKKQASVWTVFDSPAAGVAADQAADQFPTARGPAGSYR